METIEKLQKLEEDIASDLLMIKEKNPQAYIILKTIKFAIEDILADF